MKKVVFEGKDFPFRKRKWVAFVFANNNKIDPLQPIPTSASPTPRIFYKHSPSPQSTSIHEGEDFAQEDCPDVVEVIDIKNDDSVIPVAHLATQILGVVLKKLPREANAVAAIVLVTVVSVEANADQALQVSQPWLLRPHKENGVG